MTHPTDSRLFSLDWNNIGAKGASHLAQALEVNSSLQSLGYAAQALMTTFIIVSSH